MRLSKARVRSYRSVKDSGSFEIEFSKTILVGPNEAGKTVLLQALQQINRPSGVRSFDVLRDYPRALYNDITTKKADPRHITVAEVEFILEKQDQLAIPAQYHECTYTFGRRLDNSGRHTLEGGPRVPTYGSLKKDFLRLAGHIDNRPDNAAAKTHAQRLGTITEGWTDNTLLYDEQAKALDSWLNGAVQFVDEGQ